MKYVIVILFFLINSLAAVERPPNVVLFFADDLGYADLGCYGHPYSKTPNIDNLASEGTKFTQFYVTGVTCNPSRTGLMTGKFPASFQKYPASYGFGNSATITSILKKKGYVTGHFGKWHIGPESTEKNGTYGIDEIKVIGKSKGSSLGRDDDLTTAAIEFIRENKDKPFYVNVWGHSTHFPVNTAESLASKFKSVKVNRSDFSPTMQHKFDECLKIGGQLDESMHQYLGDVHSIDLNVGRLMETIDQLGLKENTIFVFSSDHGPAPVLLGNKKTFREHSKNMLGYAGEFKGGKHNQYEGGVRVPFIIRWPGKVPKGKVNSENILSFIDWLPTLSAIAGENSLPDNLDGENTSDIWQGKSRPRTKSLFWKTSSANSDASMREGKWKLHMDNKGKTLELYDLSQDPSESKNIADSHPDVVREMKKKLIAWVDQLPSEYEKTEKKKKKNK